MLTSSRRRGIRYCKCSPMREFAPAWKYRIMIILGCSRYCKGCKGENLKLWKHWQPLRVFIDRPLKSLAYLAQWERWGRSKKRENQEHFLLKAQTIVSRGAAAFLLYPSAVILAKSTQGQWAWANRPKHSVLFILAVVFGICCLHKIRVSNHYFLAPTMSYFS